MTLPVTLHRKIAEFLRSLPIIDDLNGQRAFIHSAVLGSQLHAQITFPGSSVQFIELLVPQLVLYGQLEDGRNALEAVLESAKSCVGQDRREVCDGLLQELRTLEEEPPTTLKKPSTIAKQNIAPNPFDASGQRITEVERFFDREELLRQIFEELGKGGNLSLVGERQIGKSSLLSMICALGPERIKLPPQNFIYFSLQEIDDDDDDFYEMLCDKLGIDCCRGGKFSRALRMKGERYVLCLDEFEKMTWEGFTRRIRSHLRSLADGSNEPLRLVIASRVSLEQLFKDSPLPDSPLANICHQLGVKLFPPNVARDFLKQRLKRTGIHFTKEQIDDLIEKTAGHPAKLQHEAAELYRELSGTLQRIEEWNG